jgi:hypothetical protein
MDTDKCGDLIALMVKRAIVNNLITTEDSHIKKGGRVLWNNYYRFVNYGQKLSLVTKQMEKDLKYSKSDDIIYLRAYLYKFNFNFMSFKD